jgi:hypothetical protein
MVDHALALAAEGFHVFPIQAGAKSPPLIKDFPKKATRDVSQIVTWWAKWPDANIGISTSKFLDDDALIVIDVDNKEGQHGDRELLRLELEGFDLPRTRSQFTPTGGRHLVYRSGAPVRQGASVLGRNLDVRSRGGYIVGAGSTIGSQTYTADAAPLEEAPDWVVRACGDAPDERPARTPVVSVDEDRAQQRAIQYLLEAPAAVQGQAGDTTTYKVACRVKDFGVNSLVCFDLMIAYWNERCQPPWSTLELQEKIDHAYKYGLEIPGSGAPETHFKDVPLGTESLPDGKKHWVEEMNQSFAFITAGGGCHVLWETTDHHDKYKLEHLSMDAFHNKMAPFEIQVGKKTEPQSKVWLRDKHRREYEGLCFLPEQPTPKRFYNLWRGFAYDASTTTTPHPSVDAFLDHAKTNVCGGHEALFRWLMGYFAHLIQRPWEKPLVALVFRGAKGVGKNALIERVGALLGGHFLLTSNRRYLIGNFNGHLENCLLFALDEAFWSGDKQAEGTLKDLITGRDHVIEHKGKEPYTVSNRCRVCVIGNEDWLVPASHDERRFAVFDVGDGRKQDRQFFTAMREGMEAGGYSVLLRYLRDYDLSGVDVNAAPSTTGLRDQKHSSLEPFHQWWFDSLEAGTFGGADFEGWPNEIECERFRSAFRRYSRERNIKGRMPEDRLIGRLLKVCCPSHQRGRRPMQKDDKSQPYFYSIPPLARARAEWDTFIGHENEWGKE